MALTPEEIKQYYATQGNAAKPLSPAQYEAQLRGQSSPIQTSTPSISGGLQTSGGAAPATGSNLVTFKDTLGKVMELAKQKRNETMGQFMQTPGFQGTLMASDFNSLFNQMNQQGTQYGEMAAEKLFPNPADNYKTYTETDAKGNVTVFTIDPTKTGKDAIVGRTELGAVGKPAAQTLEDKEKAKQAEYAIAESFMNANPLASDEEIRNALLKDSKLLTITEINQLLAARGPSITEDQMKARAVSLVKSTGSVAEAKKLVDTLTFNKKELSSVQKNRLKEIIDEEYPNDRTWLQSILPGGR